MLQPDDEYDDLKLADVLFILNREQQLVSERFGGISGLLQVFNQACSIGLKLKVVSCPHCSTLHFDKYIEKCNDRKCSSCSEQFADTELDISTVGNPLADVLNDLHKVKYLNFTNCAAHGSSEDGDGVHSQFAELARTELARLQQKYPTVFEEPTFPVDRTDCPQQFTNEIPLVNENAPPPKRKLYPLDSVELAGLKKQIQDLLDTQRIEPAQGPYGASILFAKKKDGRLRICIDYRMLNQQTCNDAFPLPHIDEWQ